MKRKWITAVMVVLGIILLAAGIIIDKMKTSAAISIIGGADGPTSVFLAGRISPSGIAGSCAGVIGIVLIVIAVIRMIVKRRK